MWLDVLCFSVLCQSSVLCYLALCRPQINSDPPIVSVFAYVIHRKFLHHRALTCKYLVIVGVKWGGIRISKEKEKERKESEKERWILSHELPPLQCHLDTGQNENLDFALTWFTRGNKSCILRQPLYNLLFQQCFSILLYPHRKKVLTSKPLSTHFIFILLYIYHLFILLCWHFPSDFQVLNLLWITIYPYFMHSVQLLIYHAKNV